MDEESPGLDELIERLSSVLAGLARSHWDALGLHPVHGRILVYLAHANRYSDTLTALVEYLGATKGTVSQSVELLVARGLVERLADQDDQRVSHLRLTREGRRILRDSNPPAAWKTVVQQADPRIGAGLAAMLTRLQQAGGKRSFGACHSCRHHVQEGEGRFRCGLTRESLTAADRQLWCREHDPARLDAG